MSAEDLVQQIIDLLSHGTWYVLGALVFVLFIALLDGMRSRARDDLDANTKLPRNAPYSNGDSPNGNDGPPDGGSD